MRANVEIRQWRESFPALPPVAEEALAGQEASLPGKVGASEEVPGDGGIEVFDSVKAYRDLRIDDGVDKQDRALGAAREGFRRPAAPIGDLP